MKRSAPVKPPIPERFEVEVFGNPHDRIEALRNKPSVWNGVANVERYRITVERVDEDPAVIHQRILELWDTSDNMHHVGPLRAAATKHGLDLSLHDYRGSRRPRKS